jgi:hypothetical protein
LIAALALSLTAGANAQNRVQMKPTPLGPTVLNKAAPKPDFKILHASAIGGKDNQFMVQVKNDGPADSPAAKLQGRNTNVHRSSQAVVPLPPIKAGQFVWVKVELPKAAKQGDRMSVRVDHNNAVAEIDENNNFRLFNW